MKRVKPYERNPRINDGAVDAAAKILAEFGFRQPLVVDIDGVLSVGHTRWKVARQLGLAKVLVHVARDLEPEAVRVYRIADQKTGEIADGAFDLLPIELTALGDVGYDLACSGSIRMSWPSRSTRAVQEGLTGPDDVPDPPGDPLTQKGDQWIPGDHRLLCGD